MRGCHAEKCPRCGERAPCVDHCEVDNGVGIETWNHEYYCKTHGRFAFVHDGPADFSSPWKTTVIFQDDDGEVLRSPHPRGTP